MTRKTISTDRAPAAIGPYVQAVSAGGWLWCSGQISLDPGSGEFLHAGQDEAAVVAQTRQVLTNLRGVLEAAEAGLAQVVKCTVYMQDLGHFAAMNAIYAEFFGTDAPPARACVEVSRLPKDCAVEIDAIAHLE